MASDAMRPVSAEFESESRLDRNPSGGLSCLLGPELAVDTFFAQHWEVAPCVLRGAGTAAASEILPWSDLLAMLCALQSGPRAREVEVLVLKDCVPTYDYPSFHAAYLDGCSVVINHVDKVYAPVHTLCRNLRADLPHAFSNMYLTPPHAQAVEAHADDRDLIILQVAGAKSWKVYPEPPVPFPYPNEQVGKSREYPVPQATLDAIPLIETELRAGDVLYMPRGFVHEALTGTLEPSLHLGFAFATHDWSWSSVTAGALIQAGRPVEEYTAFRANAEAREDCTRGRWWWRRSVPPALFCNAALGARRAAEELAGVAAAEVGLFADAVRSAFAAKISFHNDRQDELAPAPIASWLSPASLVRRLTDKEKQVRDAAFTPPMQQGLVAREELAELLPRILSRISTEPVRISDFEGDSGLLCSFGKICFAAVCMDLGLICACDVDGARLARLKSPASVYPVYPHSGDLRERRVFGKLSRKRRRSGGEVTGTCQK